MAFTEAEKVQIRFFCGWSARFHQFDSALEQAISAAEVETDTESFIRTDLLVGLADIRTKLVASHTRIQAMKVASINLPGPMEIMMLRSEGRRHSNSLCSTLGVMMRHDVFGSGRYRWFARHTGLVEGQEAGGNYYPHG